jgi:GT2 family glycosyltransferase
MPKIEVLPPDSQSILKTSKTTSSLVNKLKFIQHRLRALAKRLIKDNDIFIPYNFTFPQYTLPKALQNMATHPVQMMHGARMSYRYEVLKSVRFEETLERYAVNEDNDVCYRASQFGMLLHALNARLCHIQHSEGRLTRFTATALWGLNQLVLHRFHSSDLLRFKTLFRKLLWRRLFTQTLKDILDQRWTLPSARGVWFVLRHQNEILAKTPAELRIWYPQFQQTLLDRDRLERMRI